MVSKELKDRLADQKKRLGRSTWIPTFASALGVLSESICLLSPEESSCLQERFVQRLAECQQRDLAPAHGDNVFGQLALIPPSTLDEVVVFHRQTGQIGAPIVSFSVVQRSGRRIFEICEKDLSFMDRSGANGMCLEEGYYSKNGAYFPGGILCLVSWGKLESLSSV